MIKFITYFILVNAGLIFRWLHWRAEDVCKEVSHQCADAGFGWEVLGSLFLFCSCILAIFIFVNWARRYLKLINSK